METEHTPDDTRIPNPLRTLPWKAYDPFTTELFDCDRLLVVVPRAGEPWWYEIDVISIRCDESGIDVYQNGEPWCWEMSDVDFFVRLNK